MAASRRAAIVAFAAAALSVAACDALIGLDQYHDVSCAFDCEAGNVAPFNEGGDAPPDHHTADVAETSTPDVLGDVASEADADVADVLLSGEVGTPEAGWPVPTVHETWAHWPMPNPDAAAGPDSSALLPNQMAYDAGAEAGSALAYDEVTHLTWYRTPFSAASYDDAWIACTSAVLPSMAQAWRVPTRIELVSLIDFTEPGNMPTVDLRIFPAVPRDVFWTSSSVPAVVDGGPASYWTVNFTNGLTGIGTTANYALCVNGGTP